MVATRGVYGTIVDVPSAMQPVFLCDKRLPSAYFLCIFHTVVEASRGHSAVEQLRFGRFIIGIFCACVQAERRFVVHTQIVQPVRKVDVEVRGDISVYVLSSMICLVVARVNETHAMPIADIIVYTEPLIMSSFPCMGRFARTYVINVSAGLRVLRSFFGDVVLRSVVVSVHKIHG